MQVFVTGATGFIGSRLVPELVSAGHSVLGLTRSEDGEARLRDAGASAVRGDVTDHDLLRGTAARCDAVIHLAFNHAPDAQRLHSEEDRAAILALGESLGPEHGPLIVTSGTGLVQSTSGQPVTEDDAHLPSSMVPRAGSEEAAEALMTTGHDVRVVRLPQVHDIDHHGRLHWHIEIAKNQGRVCYVDQGSNRVPAAHVLDVAHLYRLVLERGTAGSRYHAVVEQGVTLRKIAEAIADRLHLPTASLSADEAAGYFGWLAPLAVQDLPASGVWTHNALAWTPTGPGLLADLRAARQSDEASVS